MATSASGLALRRAVDWKIFEIQSVLVSDDVGEDSIVECKQWFQPRHLEEVVEERINDKYCGYPSCRERLDLQENQKYRIHYTGKQVFEIGESKKFCSPTCLQNHSRLLASLDNAPVYSRSIASSLSIEKTTPKALASQEGIQDVLKLLDGIGGRSDEAEPGTENKSSDGITRMASERIGLVDQKGSEIDTAAAPPPPVYSNARISDRGKVVAGAVETQNAGKKTKKSDIEAMAESHSTTDTPAEHVPHSIRQVTRLKQQQMDMELELQRLKMEQEESSYSLAASDAAEAEAAAKSIPPAAAGVRPQQQQQQLQEQLSGVPGNTPRTAAREDMLRNSEASTSGSRGTGGSSNRPMFSPSEKARAKAARQRLENIERKTGEKAVSLDDIFATMKQLQQKHSAMKLSTFGGVGSPALNVSSSAGASNMMSGWSTATSATTARANGDVQTTPLPPDPSQPLSTEGAGNPELLRRPPVAGTAQSSAIVPATKAKKVIQWKDRGPQGGVKSVVSAGGGVVSTTTKPLNSGAEKSSSTSPSMRMGAIQERADAKVLPVGSILTKKAPQSVMTSFIPAPSAPATVSGQNIEGYVPKLGRTSHLHQPQTGAPHGGVDIPKTSLPGVKKVSMDGATARPPPPIDDAQPAITPVLAARPLFNEDRLLVDSTGKFKVEPDDADTEVEADGDDDDDLSDSHAHADEFYDDEDDNNGDAEEFDMDDEKYGIRDEVDELDTVAGQKKGMKGKRNSAAALFEKSLFLSTWEGLDLLFGPDWDAKQLESAAPVVSSAFLDSAEVVGTSSSGKNTTVNLKQRIEKMAEIKKCLGRGIVSAENLFNISRLFQSNGLLPKYTERKVHLLSFIEKYHDIHQRAPAPELSSLAWNLVGVLVLDAIVRKDRQLLDSAANASALSRRKEMSVDVLEMEGGRDHSAADNLATWNYKVEALSAAALGGAHVAASQLREGDLRILRSYFDPSSF